MCVDTVLRLSLGKTRRIRINPFPQGPLQCGALTEWSGWQACAGRTKLVPEPGQQLGGWKRSKTSMRIYARTHDIFNICHCQMWAS